ncbi:MAG: hypothetical protein GY854_33675, partial [Deltaproteobacteria bacterium]|nr:hypothetical protein [Deltaproteobacteria bacterium]
RALLLFVHACRGRPEVIKEVLEDADSLPIVVQRALVSIKAFEKQVKPKISDFSPSVQQLASSDTRKLRRMRQSIKAHIAKLMSLRFSTGDPDDPEKKERAAARNLDSDQ